LRICWVGRIIINGSANLGTVYKIWTYFCLDDMPGGIKRSVGMKKQTRKEIAACTKSFDLWIYALGMMLFLGSLLLNQNGI
jgi:hypothetical protein